MWIFADKPHEGADFILLKTVGTCPRHQNSQKLTII